MVSREPRPEHANHGDRVAHLIVDDTSLRTHIHRTQRERPINQSKDALGTLREAHDIGATIDVYGDDIDVRVDGIGNVVAVWGDATQPPVMCGSHIDTVRTGGRYDGNLGVLAGLEVIETLIEADARPRRPLAVAFFTDEEGARFAPDMLGSLVYAGGLTVEEAYDTAGIDGARLGDELERIGYQGATPCPGPAPHADKPIFSCHRPSSARIRRAAAVWRPGRTTVWGDYEAPTES